MMGIAALHPSHEAPPANLRKQEIDAGAYNNRFAQNDSNHRYASDLTTLIPLVALGWTIEGAVFSVPAN